MEVELKLSVPPERLGPLRARLAELGARDDGSRTQDDLFFSHPCRDLAGGDEAFRHRVEDGRRELTYKGPRRSGDIKTRPEINLEVQDDPGPLLEALGFVPAARLRKRRERWLLPEAEVGLDTLDGVGCFVEIEATDAEDPLAAVAAVRTRLGLEDAPVESQSYLELALARGAEAAHRL